MDIMRAWLATTVHKDLGQALKSSSSQPPHSVRGYEDDGSNLRVKVSKPELAQIVEWESYDAPLVAILSDSVMFMKATISSTAATEYQKRTGKRVTENTKGNIVQLQSAQIVATHLGPREARIALFVDKLKVVASDNSNTFGNPRPFHETPGSSLLLEELSAFRVSSHIDNHYQNVVEQPPKKPPLGSRLGNFDPAGNAYHGSQPLFSQIASHSEPRPLVQGPERPTRRASPEKSGGYSTHGKRTNNTASLRKLIEASNAVKSKAKDEVKDIQDPREVLHPVKDPSSNIQNQKDQVQIKSLEEIPKSERRRAPSAKSKASKIRSHDVKISKEQQKLLDQEDSWLPAKPGRRGPVANVPIMVLQEITQKVEEQAAEKSTKRLQEASTQSSAHTQDPILKSDSDTDKNSVEESPIPSADWPPSSPVPAPRELPPDSSVEVVNSSDDDNKDKPSQQMLDPNTTLPPENDDTGFSSVPEELVANLNDSGDAQRCIPAFTSSQTNPGLASDETDSLSPLSVGRTAENLDSIQSSSGGNIHPMTTINQGVSESESDIEMNVPLQLNEEGALATEIPITQIPGTAPESREPFTQVKRTPYGNQREKSPLVHARRVSPAAEVFSSPSKRRRVDGPGGARVPNHAQAMSPVSYLCNKSPKASSNPTQVQSSGIEETFINQTAPALPVIHDNPSFKEALGTNALPSEQLRVSTPTRNVTSSLADLSEHPREDLRRKAESPILSPHVSKRRKVHKSPFKFEFSQEQYSEEDPSVKARRYRQEFFESRKNSRPLSHGSQDEVKVDHDADSGQRRPKELTAPTHARILSDDQSSVQSIVFLPHEQSDTLCSSKVNLDSSLEQKQKDGEAVMGHAPKQSINQTTELLNPPDIDSTISISTTKPIHQEEAPAMVGVGLQQPKLLLTQGIQDDLHDISTRLERLTSATVSQQSDLNSQAKSMAELMTPALSVSEIATVTSPSLKETAAPQEHPVEKDVFLRFKTAYPDYLGTKEHFVGMCKRIWQLIQADRAEHKSLWDDFIIRHKTDFPHYSQRCIDNAEDAKPYEQFYHAEIDEPKYCKRIMQPNTLGEVIPLEKPSSTESPGTRPVSHQAGLGAQSIPTPSFLNRSSLTMSHNRASPRRDKRASSHMSVTALDSSSQHTSRSRASCSPELGKALEQPKLSPARETVDLTGDQSLSPVSTPCVQIPTLASVRSGRRSPRRASFGRQKPTLKDDLSKDDGGHDRQKGYVDGEKSHSIQLAAVARAGNVRPVAYRSESNDSSSTLEARHRELQAIGLPQDSPQGEARRARFKAPKPEETSVHHGIASSSTQKSRPQPSSEIVDEWWKDEDTPFRGYVRLYQSITPGKGNSWAQENNGSKGKGKLNDTTQQESFELRPIDVMKWSL
ncbi:MAG: hypothetical protein Q9219_001872 [cf. Caloplaca sp. 3 TL-2023]